MKNPIASLFNPKSIAIIGASETPGKAAERRTRSLLESGFRGRVYLVNPKRNKLFGQKAYPSIAEIKGRIDLAMIIIPGRFIPQAVADAAQKGAKAVIIITAGLGESGPEGKEIEARIMEAADRHGVKVVGPNCSGMYSASAKINMLGIPTINPGKISVVAQSGNVIDALTHLAKRKGQGFSKIISLGNAIGARFHEIVEFLAQDDPTEVILLYIESVRDGHKLVQAARKASIRKPIIALKVGRTTAGQRASASHTGALAADDRIVAAGFEQAGIIRVFHVDEMFDLAEALVNCPPAQGDRVAILSEGGGDNSVAADIAEQKGLRVPVLDQATQDRITPHLLAGMPAHNPIDYGGTAEENPLVVAETVAQVMSDDRIDQVFITGFFGGFQDIIAPHVGPVEIRAATRLVDLVKEHQKPLIIHSAYANDDYASLKVLRESGIPVLAGTDRAGSIMAGLAAQAGNKQKPGPIRSKSGGRNKAKEVFDQVRSDSRTNLLETESRSVLEAYQIPLPPVQLLTGPEQAAEAVRRFDHPLACKIVHPDILHKTDVGGVKLNLQGETEVRSAYLEISRQAGKAAQAEKTVGVLASPMAEPGLECIFGIVRDPSFGPVVMFGLGGIMVEVFKDVSFGVCPLTKDDIERMITSLRGFRMLTGVRGKKASDLKLIRGLIQKLSIIALENPEIQELDLNPVIVHPKGCSIVDSRLIISE